MVEATVSNELQSAFTSLKTALTKQKFRLIAENEPTSISVVQGSLWGTSAKTAQKKISFALQKAENGTRINGKVALTSGYIRLTAVGCAFSVALALLCFWIGVDLANYGATGEGYWGWLAYTGVAFSHFEPDIAAVYIRVMWILSAFLVGTLIAEAVVLAKVHAGINGVVQEFLDVLK